MITRLGVDVSSPHSLKPQIPRTSGMAEDVIVLLDFLGWTEKRSLHLVGQSLGGMIGQGALRNSHSS
jgi:pimeloyl-ACP methyl ester carboxylesterase